MSFRPASGWWRPLGHKLPPWLFCLFVVIGVLAGLCALASLVFWLSARLDPLGRDAVLRDYRQSWQILDSQGQLLREVVNPKGERARWANLADLDIVAKAVLAVEDRNFASHGGVDLPALLRAAFRNLESGAPVEGASTISMQLARLVRNHPRTLWGKILQIHDALRLESGMSKDGILECYLNLAPFAAGVQGAESAAWALFGHSAKNLSDSEAALLAGLLKAPSLYDPRTSPQAAEDRRKAVLEGMFMNGTMDFDRYMQILNDKPTILETTQAIRAGHFTDWVMTYAPPAGSVQTTLDGELQDTLEAVVKAHVDHYRDAGIGNASVVVLDARTAAVRAMVGSADWAAEGDGAVNGALALRQPGSTLKPFLYGMAFEHGYTPASIVPDVETGYYGTDSTLYVPQNYSHSFRGPVTIQEALSASLNVPAVRLVQELGLDVFLKGLKDLGFANLDKGADHYGLGLILGNGEVSLLQLAGAYGVLARGGTFLAPQPFPTAPPQAPQVMDALSCNLLTSIISDDWLRTQAFGAGSNLLFEFPVALKTGTSNNWRDNWVAGYTRDYVVAVWAGNFGAAPTNQLSGSVGAGPLFNKVLRILARRHGGSLALPDPLPGLRTVVVCAESGMAPGAHCPRSTSVRMGPGEVLPVCDVHRSVRIDRRTGALARDNTPARFVTSRTFAFLPPLYDQWQQSVQRPPPPRDLSPLQAEDIALVIQKPRQGDIYLVEPGYEPRTQSVRFSVLAVDTSQDVLWELDGKPLATHGWPYNHEWQIVTGTHTLQALQGVHRSQIVEFEVR